MKPIFSILIVFILFAFEAAPPKKIVFFGDSITQAAVKEGGFITLMQNDLKSQGLDNNYELIGKGIGGNKVYDLFLRMDEDVMNLNPNHVFIYVGVNDVWHKTTHGTGTDLDKFEKFYVALIKKIQAKNITITLCTPATIGEKTDHSNSQDGDLNEYSKVIRKLARAHNCTLIDLRNEFLTHNLKNNPENLYKGILTSDGVHLNDKGNKLVADLMMKEVIK